MVRRLAVQCLVKWNDGRSYADGLVDRAAREQKLSAGDRALLQAIVYGVLRNLSLLDHWIGQLRDGRVDDEARALLRIGLCQLLILDLAEHASVNETVNAAQKPLRGLINGCLRSALRRREELVGQIESLPLATRCSHPKWLVERWTAAFGEAAVERLLAWNQQPAPTFARVNPLREGAEGTIATYEKATPVEGAAGFYEVAGRIPRAWTEGGLAYFQDPATRHCVELLAPQPGEKVLDACAAPGGKACLIAAAMANSGELLCTDSNARRLPRLLQNLERLGVAIATTAVHDWTSPPPETLGKYDAILLDVPCSNTGVLRRRVDARWRMSPDSIAALHDIQLAILTNAALSLKPGGRLVYSTCSIDAAENQELVRAFLERHEQFSLSDERIISPHADGTDGAYAARLVLR